MKIKKQQLDRKQSLSCLHPVKQHHVSSAQCKQHWPLQGTKSREPAVTARGSYWGIPSLELDPAPGSCLARATQVVINTCPALLGDSPSSAAQNTARRAHYQQLLVIRASRGWDRPVFPEKQPRSRWAQDMAISKWFTIWTRSSWSQTTRTSWCLAQEGTENIKNHHLMQLQCYLTVLCAGVRWEPSCSEHKSRVQHAHLQYSLEILPWGRQACANRSKSCLLLTPRILRTPWLSAHAPFYLLCPRLQPTVTPWEPSIYCMKTPTHDNQPHSVLLSRQLLPFKLISLTN